MAKKSRSSTWAEVGYVNSRSMRTTFRGLTFAIRWALVTAKLGREPATVDEFCAVLDEARRTAFRDQQAFREAFPTELTPLRMVTGSGLVARFEEMLKQLDSLEKAEAQAAPMAFTLGAATANFA